jgi:hypothetical protein
MSRTPPALKNAHAVFSDALEEQGQVKAFVFKEQVSAVRIPGDAAADDDPVERIDHAVLVLINIPDIPGLYGTELRGIARDLFRCLEQSGSLQAVEGTDLLADIRDLKA